MVKLNEKPSLWCIVACCDCYIVLNFPGKPLSGLFNSGCIAYTLTLMFVLSMQSMMTGWCLVVHPTDRKWVSSP